MTAPTTRYKLIEVSRQTDGTVVSGIYEPGNGTRYLAVATRLQNGKWLASCPLLGACMYVEPGSYVADCYVQDKLHDHGRRMSDTDATEYARLIAALVPRCEAD